MVYAMSLQMNQVKSEMEQKIENFINTFKREEEKSTEDSDKEKS